MNKHFYKIFIFTIIFKRGQKQCPQKEMKFFPLLIGTKLSHLIEFQDESLNPGKCCGLSQALISLKYNPVDDQEN